MNAPATKAVNTAQHRRLEFVVLHYFPNSDIALSLDTGAAITGLCGIRGPVGAGRHGAPEGTRTVACPLCVWAHSELRTKPKGASNPHTPSGGA